MKIRIKLILVISWLLMGLQSWSQVDSIAQKLTVEWGELQRKQGSLLYLLPNGENKFYALRWAGGRLFGHYKVTKHEDLDLINSARIKLIANESIANFEGASVVDEKFVVFLSDKRDGQNHFFMQEFDEELEKMGETIHLASYSIERKQGKGTFQLRSSSNGKYFAVIWDVPGKKENHDAYGFKVFDSDMALVNEGEYKLPFEPDQSEIHEHLISNQGDYFLCLSEYQDSEKKRWFGKKKEYKALHIYRINDDIGLQDFTLDVDGRPVVALAMHSEKDETFTLTGIYGNVDQVGVAGVFFQKLNLQTGEVLQEGFSEFKEKFITQGWTDRSVKRAERRRRQGKGAPELYSYKMRDVTFLEDGSIIGTLEQYFVQVRSGTDGRSNQSSNMYYYYYNDIIAYRIDSIGEFSWVEKIQKHQASINDGGPYSSFESFVHQGNLHFIFNDNLKNYDSDQDYLNPQRVETANYSSRKNAVALATINLETGESTRRTFFNREESKALVVPKLFNVNYRTGELIIYSVAGQKERIGVIKLKD